MKIVKFTAGILVLLLLIAGFSNPGAHTETEFLMDTFVSITAYGRNASKAVDAAFLRLREIDKKCSAHKTDSELYKLNSAPENKEIQIDDELFYLLKEALYFSEASNNAFDVTLLPVTTLWGFGTEQASVPSEKELSDALALTGTHMVIVNDKNKTITKLHKSVQLDLGAVAKGYASQEALRILKEEGIKHAYLDLGGNIAVMGGKPKGLLKRLLSHEKSDPFVIGLQMPDAPRGTVMKTFSMRNGYIVTSGDYERYFEEKGKRYHHIINPQTGYPAESDIKSVTVISDNGLEADMLSTALFVLGPEKMTLFADQCRGIYVINNKAEITAIKPLTP